MNEVYNGGFSHEFSVSMLQEIIYVYINIYIIYIYINIYIYIYIYIYLYLHKVIQVRIKRSFTTGQLLRDPKFLSQTNEILKILK